MKEYLCEYAYRKDEFLYCKKKNDLCGNSYFCRMGNRYKLNEFAEKCPLKNKETEVVKPTPKKKVKKDEQK